MAGMESDMAQKDKNYDGWGGCFTAVQSGPSGTSESAGSVVVCAANRLASGLIVCGARHHDTVMNAQIKASGESHVGETQGFIDQFGNFLTRSEALQIAKANGQIKRRCGGDSEQLFSENLY